MKKLFIGRLGRDPEMSYSLKKELAVCRFDIAINFMGKDQPVWRKIVLFGENAKKAVHQIKKGMKVFIEGVEREVRFKNREGKEVTYLEVRGDSIGVELR